MTELAGARGVGSSPANPQAPDPDPTPTATPWQEYLAAAQSLDAVVREAGAASAASRASDAVRVDLARILERLERQRSWLVGEAVRAGLRSPQLIPTPAELAAAQAPMTAADPATVAEALRRCQRLLDLADAQLTQTPPVVSAPPVPGAPAVTGSLPMPAAPPMPTGPPPQPSPPPQPRAAPVVPPPASPVPLAGPVTGELPAQLPGQMPGQVSPAPPPVPPDRSWWPPPVWLLVAVPLGAATLFLFVFTILVAVLR